MSYEPKGDTDVKAAEQDLGPLLAESTARILYERARDFAKAIAAARPTGVSVRVSLGAGIEAPVLRALAEMLGTETHIQLWNGRIIEALSVYLDDVEFAAQGDRPVEMGDLERLNRQVVSL